MSHALDQLRQRSKQRNARIVLPETSDPRVQAARAQIDRDGLGQVIWVEDPSADPRFDEIAAHVLARRQHKGVTAEQARELAALPLIFGAGLVATGHADCGVSGAAHATPEVIRAGLICLGTAPSIPLVSSMFLLVRGDEVLSFADCGVIPDPDSEQLVHIANATANNHKLLTGTEPRVAFLSFSTHGSASHPKVDKMRTAGEQFRATHPNVVADGELQFDAAYVSAVAQRKSPDSPLNGDANVLVFPDLDSGNIAYKLAERLAGFEAYGPLLQGLDKPWLDLSRGCSAEDIVGVATMASAMLG
jgi:phosphate acetyltransferase